jgi:hypothetical protein
MLGIKKSQNELRFTHIHNLILIQDTHKMKGINQSGIVMPIYHVTNENVATTEINDKADQALRNLI